MSLTDAYALVRPHLPREMDEKVNAQWATFGLADEMTLDGFSLWKVKDAANLAFIIERRSRSLQDWDFHFALGRQHKLLVEALQNGTQDQLWQAYVVSDDEHIGFVLNLATGIVLIS